MILTFFPCHYSRYSESSSSLCSYFHYFAVSINEALKLYWPIFYTLTCSIRIYTDILIKDSLLYSLSFHFFWVEAVLTITPSDFFQKIKLHKIITQSNHNIFRFHATFVLNNVVIFFNQRNEVTVSSIGRF